MPVKAPKPQRAALVPLSHATDAVIYGRRGAVKFLHGGQSFGLNDLEMDKLELARSSFLNRVTVEEEAVA